MDESNSGSTATLRSAPRSLEEIRAAAQKHFPHNVLDRSRSALCLFGAASRGKCDLIHLLDGGVGQVTVVDDSSVKMAELSEIFPATWEYRVENCLAACQRLLAEEKRFDVVVCDGSAGVVDHIWEELLPFACDLGACKTVVKLNSEYLALKQSPATPAGVAALAKSLHGADLVVEDLVVRSRGKGGTYWAVLAKKSPGVSAVHSSQGAKAGRSAGGANAFHEIEYGRDACVPLEDLIGQQGCSGHAQCRETINKFRLNVAQKESQSIYRAYTSRAFSQLSRGEIDRQKLTAACFDLGRFADHSEFLEAARNATTKKGRTNREIGRAQREGFYVKSFDHELFLPDLCAIHGSKELRGGKPMKDHYATAGGPAASRGAAAEGPCGVHANVHWGVFKPEAGYAQGSVVTNERLVAYIHWYRYGNHCWYSRIMGHGDYLKFGVMYLLHSTLVEKLLALRSGGLQYLFYGGMNSGPKDGSLRTWKQRNLFEPRYLIYDEAGDWKSPAGMAYR